MGSMKQESIFRTEEQEECPHLLRPLCTGGHRPEKQEPAQFTALRVGDDGK